VVKWLSFFFFSRFFLSFFSKIVCELRELNLLIAHTMQTFTVKSAAAKSKIEKPRFWVLCKGMNSGKPLSLPCPNSFRVEAETEEVKELLYWVSFALWRSKAFHPHLIGSVIPFIRIRDYQNLVLEKLEVVNESPAEFAEAVKKLQFMELKEKQFRQNLQLIGDLKRAYVHQYFNRRR
jgi:hypothetical protein